MPTADYAEVPSPLVAVVAAVAAIRPPVAVDDRLPYKQYPIKAYRSRKRRALGRWKYSTTSVRVSAGVLYVKRMPPSNDTRHTVRLGGARVFVHSKGRVRVDFERGGTVVARTATGHMFSVQARRTACSSKWRRRT